MKFGPLQRDYYLSTLDLEFLDFSDALRNKELCKVSKARGNQNSYVTILPHLTYLSEIGVT